MINICELFASVQGEGMYLGQPSLFIRTSGCNLRCRWGTTLCDTDYASWTPEQNPMPIDEIMAEVRGMLERYPVVNHVVVTGGEPMLQEELPELLTALKALGLFITLETNGTVPPPVGLPVDLASLSPKLASSTPTGSEFEAMHEAKRIDLLSMKKWVERYSYQLKFVIFQAGDEEEILSILKGLGNIPAESVFLMPEGISIDQLQIHAEECLEISMRHGWRYTPRAHIEVFGNRRGR